VTNRLNLVPGPDGNGEQWEEACLGITRKGLGILLVERGVSLIKEKSIGSKGPQPHHPNHVDSLGCHLPEFLWGDFRKPGDI